MWLTQYSWELGQGFHYDDDNEGGVKKRRKGKHKKEEGTYLPGKIEFGDHVAQIVLRLQNLGLGPS